VIKSRSRGPMDTVLLAVTCNRDWVRGWNSRAKLRRRI